MGIRCLVVLLRLGYCIVKHIMLPSTVKNIRIKWLIKLMDPHYQPFHKHFCEETLSHLKVECRERELSHFIAPSDLWLSCISDPYMSFTGHFTETVLKLLCLFKKNSSFIHCPGVQADHIGVNISVFFANSPLKIYMMIFISSHRSKEEPFCLTEVVI